MYTHPHLPVQHRQYLPEVHVQVQHRHPHPLEVLIHQQILIPVQAQWEVHLAQDLQETMVEAARALDQLIHHLHHLHLAAAHQVGRLVPALRVVHPAAVLVEVHREAVVHPEVVMAEDLQGAVSAEVPPAGACAVEVVQEVVLLVVQEAVVPKSKSYENH